VPPAEADASGDLTGTFATFIASLRTTLLERYGDPATVGGSFTPACDGPATSVTEVVGGPLDAPCRPPQHGFDDRNREFQPHGPGLPTN
jgi:cytochrome P450/NADPH-cytochrome P450 reductase